MPQLEFATYAPQLIWLAISFVFLYLMMSRVALPRIGAVIEQRRDKIADDLDRAAGFKKDAEEALEAYEQALAAARGRAHEIAAANREKVKGEADAKRAATDARLAEQMTQAETRIQETKEAALSNVRGIAVEAAEAIVAKLIDQTIDRSASEAAVDAELK